MTGNKNAKTKKKSNAEKPISLWGASFREVVGALLKTRPMTKDGEKESEGEKSG